MPETPLEKVISMLDSERFNVTLGLDKGGFQKLVLANWWTIKTCLENEAKRRRHLSLVGKVNAP